MNNNMNTFKTTNLVDVITLIKEKELYLQESKLLKLEKLIVQDPNNALLGYKYNLIKQRYEQLRKTTFKLEILKQQLKKIIN